MSKTQYRHNQLSQFFYALILNFSVFASSASANSWCDLMREKFVGSFRKPLTDPIAAKNAQELYLATGKSETYLIELPLGGEIVQGRLKVFTDRFGGRQINLHLPKDARDQEVEGFDGKMYHPSEFEYGKMFQRVINIYNRYQKARGEKGFKISSDPQFGGGMYTGYIEAKVHSELTPSRTEIVNELMIYMHNGRVEDRFSIDLLNALYTEGNLRITGKVAKPSPP